MERALARRINNEGERILLLLLLLLLATINFRVRGDVYCREGGGERVIKIKDKWGVSNGGGRVIEKERKEFRSFEFGQMIH